MVNSDRDFWTLDFEASGLDLKRSYPIEVGYTDGTMKKVFYIKPVKEWTYWNKDSEYIHKINRAFIEEYGFDVKEVCEKMNLDLQGQSVIVDGGEFDYFWLNRLYAAANMQPTFRLQSVSHPNFKSVEHRALSDAIQLWNWVSEGLKK